MNINRAAGIRIRLCGVGTVEPWTSPRIFSNHGSSFSSAGVCFLSTASGNDDFRFARDRLAHLGLRLQQLPRRHPPNDQLRLVRHLGGVHARSQSPDPSGRPARRLSGAFAIKKFESEKFVATVKKEIHFLKEKRNLPAANLFNFVFSSLFFYSLINIYCSIWRF